MKGFIFGSCSHLPQEETPSNLILIFDTFVNNHNLSNLEGVLQAIQVSNAPIFRQSGMKIYLRETLTSLIKVSFPVCLQIYSFKVIIIKWSVRV